MNVLHKQSDRIITQILSTNSPLNGINGIVKRRILTLLYIQERHNRHKYCHFGLDQPKSYLYTQNQNNYTRSTKILSGSNCHIISHYIGFGLTSDVGNKKTYNGFSKLCEGNTKIMTLEQAEKEIGFPCIIQMREKLPVGLKIGDTIVESEYGVPQHTCIILGRDKDNDIVVFEQRGLGGNIGIRNLKQIRYGNIYSFGPIILFREF